MYNMLKQVRTVIGYFWLVNRVHARAENSSFSGQLEKIIMGMLQEELGQRLGIKIFTRYLSLSSLI